MALISSSDTCARPQLTACSTARLTTFHVVANTFATSDQLIRPAHAARNHKYVVQARFFPFAHGTSSTRIPHRWQFTRRIRYTSVTGICHSGTYANRLVLRWSYAFAIDPHPEHNGKLFFLGRISTSISFSSSLKEHFSNTKPGIFSTRFRIDFSCIPSLSATLVSDNSIVA